VAKKRHSAQANKPADKQPAAALQAPGAPGQAPLDIDGRIKAIIEKGKKRGYLTYEEMNADLPEEMISPVQLDTLLSTLDEMGISLIDEADVDKQAAAPEIEEEDFEPAEIEGPIAPVEEEHIEEDKIIEKELVIEEEPGRRIDDPIRTYLTQMGEIPLLSRDSEISLARKIEVSRMAFRHR
jgi:RNA polymerase primary sigma factor